RADKTTRIGTGWCKVLKKIKPYGKYPELITRVIEAILKISDVPAGEIGTQVSRETYCFS
ncbi:MAG: hypothetical protein KAJ25_01680, partial [Desulfobacula sp.]|nr:hypothetical protein [Desulfobacula sp.]